MAFTPKQVNYRVAGGPCRTGFIDTASCTAGNTAVYSDMAGAVLVAGAVVTLAGDCPAEVVVVSTPPVVLPAAGVQFDRETVTLCDPATGASVVVVTLWDAAVAPGTAPIVEAYNANGTPYTGAVALLAKCAADAPADTETLDQVVCDGVNTYTHTTFVNSTTLAATGSIWRDASGTAVPAPAGPFTFGECQPAAAPFEGLTDAQLRASAVSVVGPLTDVQLRAAPVAVSGPVTDAQLRASPVQVTGTTTVANPGPTAAEIAAAVDAATRASSVPVTGPLTDAQLRAAPVVVSGTTTVSNPGPTAVEIADEVDAAMRAAPVPVVGPLTDAELRASPLSVTLPAVTTALVTLSTCASGGDGLPTTVLASVSTAPSTAVHTPIDRPLMVKTCQVMSHHNTVQMCDPTTGAPVLVVTAWRDGGTITNAPVVAAYTLDGTGYGGAVNALVQCSDAPDIETVDTDVCVSGVSYTRVSFFDAATRVLTGTVWLDTNGATVAAPAGVVTLGACESAVVTPTFTPAVFTTSAAGSVAAGTRSIAVFNRGLADGSVAGSAIPSGMGISFEAPAGGVLGALTYSGVGTILVISEVR